MADDIQMGEPKVDGSPAPAEVIADADPALAKPSTTAIAVEESRDGVGGNNGVAGREETVVDEVVDATDGFGGSRVIGRESSENGNDDEPSSRRGRRGRSRSASRSRSRSRDRAGTGAGAGAGAGPNADSSRDRARERDASDRDRDREREREHDRSRGRDRDAGNGRDNRERGRDDSRERNRGSDAARDRDRGRENSRERDRGGGASRERDWGRDERERDRMRGRERDSFDGSRDRARQVGGQGQGRRDRGPVAPMDVGRGGGREPFRGRGPPGSGPMMQQMGVPMGNSLPMMQPMGVPGAPMFPPQAGAHGQMVFTTTQRPQQLKVGQQTRMYNILPMISFKAFMAEQREDVTPEECKQRYDEYKADYTQRLTHSFIDVHRTEEWFLERYHPTVIEQKKQDKLKWAAKEATVFAQQLLANPATAIASAALEPISEQQRWGGVDKRKKRPRNSSREDASIDGVEEDSDQLPDTEAKDDEDGHGVDLTEFPEHVDRVVFLRRIPAWISTEELGRQISTEAPKHERILCSDAANTRNEDFARSAFIVYDTKEKAARSVQKLNKMRIYQTPKPKAKISKKASHSDSKHFELKTFTYKPRSPSSAEQDFSTAKRIAHDTKQTLKLAESLDEEFGRTDMSDSISVLLNEPQILDALASSSAGTAQLDLVCAYLKRVYLFVYYRAHQCRDEGDMVSSRGSCRSMAAPPKEEIQEALRLTDAEDLDCANGAVPTGDEASGSNATTATNGGASKSSTRREYGLEHVDEVAAARIKEAENGKETRKKDAAFLERYDSRVKEEISKWQATHTGRTDEGYARCGMPKCAKLFKAPEFVHKHLINKHADKHKIIVDEVSDPYVRELFFADDNKPLPNIVADANTPPVVMLPGAMAMGGAVAAMQPGPPPMAPNYPMMGGMPMGHMGAMAPPSQMGGMGDYPMQMPIPQDAMMGSAGRGFRGRGGPGFGGRGGGGRFGGRGMGRMENRPAEPIGPRDPRSLISYIDVDAPKETTPDLDYGDAFPTKKKKRKTM